MLKELAVNMLKTAKANLLNSFLKIRPEEVHKQILPELNTIMWIIGHCMAHFHKVLCHKCHGQEIFSDGANQDCTLGTMNKELLEVGTPLTFSQLVDCFLSIFDEIISNLQNLEDEDFEKVLFPEYGETLLESVQRVTLHFMSHMGQIVILRRALGNPGPTFVGGVQASHRDEMIKEWDAWWSANKHQFGN